MAHTYTKTGSDFNMNQLLKHLEQEVLEVRRWGSEFTRTMQQLNSAVESLGEESSLSDNLNVSGESAATPTIDQTVMSGSTNDSRQPTTYNKNPGRDGQVIKTRWLTPGHTSDFSHQNQKTIRHTPDQLSSVVQSDHYVQANECKGSMDSTLPVNGTGGRLTKWTTDPIFAEWLISQVGRLARGDTDKRDLSGMRDTAPAAAGCTKARLMPIHEHDSSLCNTNDSSMENLDTLPNVSETALMEGGHYVSRPAAVKAAVSQVVRNVQLKENSVNRSRQEVSASTCVQGFPAVRECHSATTNCSAVRSNQGSCKPMIVWDDDELDAEVAYIMRHVRDTSLQTTEYDIDVSPGKRRPGVNRGPSCNSNDTADSGRGSWTAPSCVKEEEEHIYETIPGDDSLEDSLLQSDDSYDKLHLAVDKLRKLRLSQGAPQVDRTSPPPLPPRTYPRPSAKPKARPQKVSSMSRTDIVGYAGSHLYTVADVLDSVDRLTEQIPSTPSTGNSRDARPLVGKPAIQPERNVQCVDQDFITNHSVNFKRKQNGNILQEHDFVPGRPPKCPQRSRGFRHGNAKTEVVPLWNHELLRTHAIIC